MARYIVPDTAALAAALYREVHAANADPLLAAIRLQAVDAVAPALALAEFLNLSRRNLEGYGGFPPLPRPDVEAVIADFCSLPVTWLEFDAADTAAAWLLYRDHRVHTGDAYFLHAAIEWNAELWTTDTRFYQQAAYTELALANEVIKRSSLQQEPYGVRPCELKMLGAIDQLPTGHPGPALGARRGDA